MFTKHKILSVLFVSLFLSSMLFIGVGFSSIHQATLSVSDQGSVPADYPSTDLDNRNTPVSILVYTEFADTTTAAPYNEFRNTMDIIENTFGPQFYYDNLTTYTQLSSMLPGHDILLIPEQENLWSSNVTDIASSWTSILTTFVTNGGIVVALDCNAPLSDLSDGPTMKILNETGLMTVYNAFDGVGWTNNLVAPEDALARGVAGTWSAPDGSVYFDTSDATVVVDTGGHAVAAHKIIGAGHVVLLGFDAWTTEINSELLLANAIRLHRHVVFDHSHANLYSVTSGYSLFANDLADNGFAVSGMDTFDEAYLQAAEILVIPTGDYHPVQNFTPSELDIIEEFVNSGGGLFIISEYGAYGNTTDLVSERFGFVRTKNHILYDSDDFNPAGSGYSVIYGGAANIINHSVTLNVNNLETWAGTGLESMPANADSLIVTDTDGTTTYDSITPAAGVTVAAAATYGLGRVVFIGESDLFSDSDLDSDGTEAYFDTDSEQFARNCIGWLSAAGMEERTIVFDQSKTPNCSLQDWLAGLGTLLTENGYTLKWMSSFLPDLISGADILFIMDGTGNYTPTEIATITSFVSNGGGLYLVGAWGEWIEQTEPIGHEFGFGDTNLTELIDTDDTVGAPSYIVFDGNNIGNHPITTGISRVELYRCGIIETPNPATSSIITTDTDGTSDYIGGEPADGLSVMAATLFDKGRVFYSADYLGLRDGYDDDSDGYPNLWDSDNDLLYLNAFYWLSENRAPSVTVTFPNGGEVLNGTRTITWDAVDFDSDTLTFQVQYSDNNGSDWSTLATGVLVSEFEWNTTLHDDGTSYLIRVIASDGQLTAYDDSDNLFELDNYAGGGFPPGLTLILLLAIAGVAVVVLLIAYFMNKRRKGAGPPPKKSGGKKKKK
ncbi:MAG: hypothetical protein ACFFFK_01690 [Candidatus Thorarchaeota archaeon]